MARIVVERIQLPISRVPGEKPPATLLDGELWVNSADRMLYVGVTGGVPTPLDGVDIEPLVQQIQDLQTKLRPPLDNGYHAKAEASGAGGVPTLGSTGQLDPSLLKGADMAPAFAGEVPKFKGNGLVDTSLIDYDFRWASEPSVGKTPTVADAGKLVRLDNEGKIELSFLGLDPLNSRGVVQVDDGGTLLSAVVNGNGASGDVWTIRNGTKDEHDINLATGECRLAQGAMPPTGFVRVTTGDLLIKDSQLQAHLINAEVMNDSHLLPRDGTRAMVGDLLFAADGSGARHSIIGALAVSTDELRTDLIKAGLQPGNPNAVTGAIESFVIDGEKNRIVVRSGGDPAVAAIDDVMAGELYVEKGKTLKLYRHDGTNWQLLFDEGEIASLKAQIEQLKIDVASLKKIP